MLSHSLPLFLPPIILPIFSFCADQIYGDRFIITTAKSAKYSETKNGHKTVTVDLKNAPRMFVKSCEAALSC